MDEYEALELMLERVRSDIDLIQNVEVVTKLKELELLLVALVEPWNY